MSNLNLSSLFGDASSSDAIRSMFNRRLLERGQYEWIHGFVFRRESLMESNGDTMIFRRYPALSLPSGQLQEGVAPSPKVKTKVDVATTLKIYGDVIEDTAFLRRTQPEDVQAVNVDLLGQQMGEYMDQLDRNAFTTGTNLIFSNGASVAAVNTIVDADDLNRALRLLKNNKSKPFVPEITASVRIGTFPIRESWWALCDTNVEIDLWKLSDFRQVHEYGNSQSAIVGEIGSFKNGLRFLASPNGYVQLGAGATGGTSVQETSTNADVYSIFCVGQESVVGVDLANMNGGVIVKPFESGGPENPLNMRSTTGWIKYYTNAILNNAFFVTIHCAVSV